MILGFFAVAILMFLTIVVGIAIKVLNKKPTNPPFDYEIPDYIKRRITRYLFFETDFEETPYFILSRMKLNPAYTLDYFDSKTKMRLRVSRVSCYSDLSGITNYQGFLFSLIYKNKVLKNYTKIEDFIYDYKTNPLILKQSKILEKLKDLEKDFE